jgi:hypothetical protein
MRPNHQRRQRGRNGKPNKFPNRNQSYDSNGPDVRVRGTAHQIFEKYQALAREAATSGDRVMAEAYYQHAEHYFRIIQAQGGFVQPRFPQPWEESDGSEEATHPGGDGVAAESGMGGRDGVDPADGPQPSIDYPSRGGGSAYASGDDYQQSREGYSNGEERYRGRDDNRGGEGRGFDQRRQERRDDDGGYHQRGRRDFVTRAEQRYQERQDRFERPQQAPDSPPVAAPTPAPPPASADAGPPAGQPASEMAAEPALAAAPDATAPENAGADNRNPREGRPFRPRHPHFRRFRGGPRGQGGVDPAQQDQPDLTGSGSGNGSN